MVGRIWAMRGQVDRGIQEIEEGIRLARLEAPYRPAIAVLHYEKGMIEASAFRDDDAADSFRAALREDPGLTSAAEALDALGRRAPRGP
jgi:hypothetical protein